MNLAIQLASIILVFFAGRQSTKPNWKWFIVYAALGCLLHFTIAVPK